MRWPNWKPTGAAASVNGGAAIEVSEAVIVRFLPPHSWFQATSAKGCQSPSSTDPRQPSWLTAELRVCSPNDRAVTPLVPVSVKPFSRTCCSTIPATGPVVTWPKLEIAAAAQRQSRVSAHWCRRCSGR